MQDQIDVAIMRHIEVQYLASKGVLARVIDAWLEKPLYDSNRTELDMNVYFPATDTTFLKMAFIWSGTFEGHSYWSDIEKEFREIMYPIWMT